MQEQNFQVNYKIDVDSTKGTREVENFAKAVGQIVSAKTNFSAAITNIKNFIKQVDKAFLTKDGQAKKHTYKISIDTASTVRKLTNIKTKINEISELATGFNKKGTELFSNELKLKTSKAIEKLKRVQTFVQEIKEAAANINLKIESARINTKGTKNQIQNKFNDTSQKQFVEAFEKSTLSSVKRFHDIQEYITKTIGKINAAFISLSRERVININIDVAKERLQEILALLNKIKGATKMTLGLQMNSPSPTENKETLDQKAILAKDEKEQHRLYRQRAKAKMAIFQQTAKEGREAMRFQEEIKATRLKYQLNKEKELEKQKRNQEREERKLHERNAAFAIRNAQKQQYANDVIYGNKRRAAINRLQYSKSPSFRSIPFISMINGYMAYSLIKSQLSSAVNYANIMESARSILRVADTDLSTFEDRFDKMSRKVRQIGVDTKYTAVEIAAATKFLAMAGMDISTINNAMRPITDLALIGDHDVSQIADLTTNIMSGYNIKNTSMNSVADMLASSVSRSNVNIMEMAESFKMAGGYLKIAGVDFSEAAAAIGILGNSGIKGTMAGTALRAMSTRFAKPTKEAEEALDRLHVKFTHFVDVYGKKVEKLRPLADIFKDLYDAGASFEDMATIFGKIGGNASMQFVVNFEKLRQLSAQNRGSWGIAHELALVKQQTTKGLWDQTTSTFTEGFMRAFESVEPIIRRNLKEFLTKFSAPRLAEGLSSISHLLLDIVSAFAQLGTWITKNFNWIEPILITGFAATRLFKLAGALTNVGVAIGFVGKQSASTSLISTIANVNSLTKNLTFANKRAIVSALQNIGISGKGAMSKALHSAIFSGQASTFAARSAFAPLFAQQVVTGQGLIGAGGSIAALGTGAVAATAGITTLVAALGYVAYKTWKIKEAKDAVLEEIQSNRKYRYPSLDALYETLAKTYKQAIDTRRVVEDVTSGKTIEEESGVHAGTFTGNWWLALLSSWMFSSKDEGLFTFKDALQADIVEAINTIAQKDSQLRINTAYADLGKLKTPVEVNAFMKNIKKKFGQNEDIINNSLVDIGMNGETVYKKDIGQLSSTNAATTKEYADYQNNVTVPEITRLAEVYRNAIATTEGAWTMMVNGGFDFVELTDLGFTRNKNGIWEQKALPKNATDQQRSEQLANFQVAHDMVVKFMASLRQTLGGSAEAAENVMQKAGFSSTLYANDPDYNNKEPFNANRITSDEDDGLAGGNYSGTGKLSSVAPKQVIVNISNLLSIDTIDLLKSNEGQQVEIQNLKEQLAEALIDVVHDFDASWNG